MHDIEAYVDFDSIIGYAVSRHEVDFDESGDGNKDNDNGMELLAYMAGQKSSCGGVRQVLASKQTPDKQKKRQVNESVLAPSTVTIDGTTYYMHKGEAINFQRHHYSAHMTKCRYCVGQHDVSDMEYALVDRGANGGICGSAMKVLEGSERFVDVFGLAGHKVSQLCMLQHRHWLQHIREMS
jgi:hypothetical protein